MAAVAPQGLQLKWARSYNVREVKRIRSNKTKGTSAFV